VKPDTPHILLINPWIYDFAAYDFWAKPIGLLYLAAISEQHGVNVSFMDCLNRFHPQARLSDPHARHGRGNYLKTRIPKPPGLDDIPRHFSRYGIREEWFREDLRCLPAPDLILVTSLMTYWYPGIRDAICILREYFPNTPIILGGIYATLCTDHARKYCGADRVITGAGEQQILDIVAEYCGFSVTPKADPDDLNALPYPAFHLESLISYIPILTSRGCPFSCAYCASRILEPNIRRRNPENVVDEIRFWHEKYGVKNFPFYDDALLADPEHHAIPMLEKIIASGINVFFHTPNALHIREITPYIAKLMFDAGFETIRLGLETTAFEDRKELDRKVTESEFRQAISCLKAAGFKKEQIGAYLLTGLPGQSLSSVETSINVVRESGIKPVLAQYTPIPHTALWKKAVASSRYDLESDPIFTNNAVLPCSSEAFSWQTLTYLKNLANMSF
jgi:hypothetical protein